MIMKSINVLSLFDGMSCGQIALKELNYSINKYYASEIDKYAIKQTQLNFPNTIQLGDVTKWREWDIDWESINLILAGSPCQGFSFAGKQLAFDDERSKLFFVFIDIFNHVKKKNKNVMFLLENVNMKFSHLHIISKYCGVFPVNINSNLVSAQNRNRWYWTNIRTKNVGLFSEIYSDIPQPKDRNILLRDILEDNVDEKYYISQAVINRINRKKYSKPSINPNKTGTLNTKNNSGQMSIDSGTTFISVNGKAPTQRSPTGRSLDKKHNFQFIKIDTDGRIGNNQEKSSCITAGGGHGAGNHSDMDLICLVAMSGRGNGHVPIIYKNHTAEYRHSYEGFDGYLEKSPTVKASGGSGNDIIVDKIRRITPAECARLQTIPEWYKWECSETQQYKMLGNGWTVEVIKHILKYLNLN